MVAWNDAQILDESKRNDKLTDAFISQKKVGQWLTFLINGIFTLVTFVAFLITRDPASFGFLAIPGVTIAINVWQSKHDRSDSE